MVEPTTNSRQPDAGISGEPHLGRVALVTDGDLLTLAMEQFERAMNVNVLPARLHETDD